ncbi:MAG TPA: DUF1559 domain-containing protein [Capsulimonadaceae bacterium]
MNRTTGKAESTQGFTLIELLVVIAIIAILAAILFPVFATAREKARQSSCQSNEKQIGLALLQYVQDFDEQLPVAMYAPSSTFWVTIIAPYAGQGLSANFAGFYTCPSDPNAATGVNNVGRKISYAINVTQPFITAPTAPWWRYKDASNVWHTYGVQMNTIADVPGTIMIAEIASKDAVYVGGAGYAEVTNPVFDTAKPQYGYLTQDVLNSQAMSINPSTNTVQTIPIARHSGGWDYLFCDGHVKWLQPQQTINGAGLTAGTLYNPKGMWTTAAND